MTGQLQVHVTRVPGLGRAGIPLQRSLSRWSEAALHAAGHDGDAELSILLADEASGRSFNQQYRNRDQATNVLSFPAELPPGVELPLLGDLILCCPVIAREARQQRKALNAHYAHMVIHGVLHLLGLDHQHEEEAVEMESLERAALARLGIADPYRDLDAAAASAGE